MLIPPFFILATSKKIFFKKRVKGARKSPLQKETVNNCFPEDSGNELFSVSTISDGRKR